MTLLALKKIWTWLKNYWYIPAIAVGIVVLTIVSGGKVPTALIAAFQKARETHKKEIEILDSVHKEEIQKRDKALAVYHDTVSKIEEKYQESNEKLTTKKKKEIKKLVEQNAEDPTELTKQIAQLTGFEVVLPE